MAWVGENQIHRLPLGNAWLQDTRQGSSGGNEGRICDVWVGQPSCRQNVKEISSADVVVAYHWITRVVRASGGDTVCERALGDVGKDNKLVVAESADPRGDGWDVARVGVIDCHGVMAFGKR